MHTYLIKQSLYYIQILEKFGHNYISQQHGCHKHNNSFLNTVSSTMLNRVVFTVSLESSEAKFLSLPPTGELGSAGNMTLQALREIFFVLLCWYH